MFGSATLSGGGSVIPADRLDWLCADLPDPDRARTRLRRWIEALTSPDTGMAQLEAVPQLAKTFALLMSASHDVADWVMRNPELGLAALDPATATDLPLLRPVQDEARRLIKHTVSFAHRLDRLRFIKDRNTLTLAIADVGNYCEPRMVWNSISVLAEALLVVAAEVVWSEVRTPEMPEELPVGIVAFGKLAGRELNYSSDVDLMFLVADDTPEEWMGRLSKFGERFRAAVSDRMGRGALYRVDLRLRPFGSQGPLMNTIATAENYYRRFAETWEHLALVRSRVIHPIGNLNERWEALRDEISFRPNRTELVVDTVIGLRDRTEELGGSEDIKRGAGGIRDVEFLVQLFQLLYGALNPALKGADTLTAIRTLAGAGLISPEAAITLTEGYTFLRQVEHRCQLRGGNQTHVLPAEPMEREILALTLGLKSDRELRNRLYEVRTSVRAEYDRTMPGKKRPQHADVPAKIHTWFSRLPEPESYLQSLVENQNSLGRVSWVAAHAPALLNDLAENASVTEEILSGEVLEELTPEMIQAAILRSKDLAAAARNSWLRIATRSVLTPDDQTSLRLAARAEALLVRLADGLPVTILIMGSAANRELSWHSDVDLLILSDSEDAAKQFVGRADELQSRNAKFKIDTRLRPDGRKGSISSSLDRIHRYSEESMESWERFALSQATLGTGNYALLEQFLQAICRPLTPEECQKLHDIYQRMTTERTQAATRESDIKLGPGSLNAIQWATQLTAITHWPDLVKANEARSNLAKQLTESKQFLLRCRHALGLMGWESDVLPSDPDKLRSIHELVGVWHGDEILQLHRDIRQLVQSHLNQAWELLLHGQP